MKPAASNLVQADTVEQFDVEQGSSEWFKLRLGMPTASNFGTIMASGRGGGESMMREQLMNTLAAEIYTGGREETYKSRDMERGNEMEPIARDHYSFISGVEVSQVGFVRRTIHRPVGPLIVGCSPDAFVGDERVLEIKTLKQSRMIALIKKGLPPTEHRAQVQGLLWVTGRRTCDLMFFCQGLPDMIFKYDRDETYIRELCNAVEVFDYELYRLVDKIRAMAK
jgi:hypothetical protein